MSVTPGLQRHFKKQKDISLLVKELNEIKSKIHPDFIRDFESYRIGLMGLVSENISVVDAPEVRDAILRENKRIEQAFWINGRFQEKRTRAYRSTIKNISSTPSHK